MAATDADDDSATAFVGDDEGGEETLGMSMCKELALLRLPAKPRDCSA